MKIWRYLAYYLEILEMDESVTRGYYVFKRNAKDYIGFIDMSLAKFQQEGYFDE